MRWQDFDDLIQEAMPAGKTGMFLWYQAAKPQPIVQLRPIGKTGKGLIAKYLDYIKGKENFREFCGVGKSFQEAKALIIFVSFTIDTASDYRRWWYARHKRIATARHGSLFTPMELAKTIPDRRFQFQLNINFDTLEIEEIDERNLRNHLASATALGHLMAEASKANRGF